MIQVKSSEIEGLSSAAPSSDPISRVITDICIYRVVITSRIISFFFSIDSFSIEQLLIIVYSLLHHTAEFQLKALFPDVLFLIKPECFTPLLTLLFLTCTFLPFCINHVFFFVLECLCVSKCVCHWRLQGEIALHFMNTQ